MLLDKLIKSLPDPLGLLGGKDKAGESGESGGLLPDPLGLFSKLGLPDPLGLFTKKGSDSARSEAAQNVGGFPT